MFGAILGALKSGMEALATFLRLRERAKNEEAGATAERLKQKEAADEIRRRMDGVHEPDRRALVDRLRDGEL